MKFNQAPQWIFVTQCASHTLPLFDRIHDALALSTLEASNANVATFLADRFGRDLSNITLAVPSCIVLSDLSKG